MTQTLNVEYEELMTRADEIEAPLPPIPNTNPQAPCGISFVIDAAADIAISANDMRLYLNAVQREWRILAKSLRNAAKAYEEVDEGAADAINDDSASSNLPPAGVGDRDVAWTPPPPPPPQAAFQYPYYEVRQAAKDIESGDQGEAFKAFAAEWDAFQRKFVLETNRFRPFSVWEGEARGLVEQNFEAHRQWIYSMTQLCSTLAGQAKKVVEAHKKATLTTGYHNQHSQEGAHPTTYEVSQCDYWYKMYTERYTVYLYMAIEWYERLQTQSETALTTYVNNAGLPLQRVSPKSPVTSTVINPPDDSSNDDEKGGDDTDLNLDDTNIPTPTLPTTPTVPTPPLPMTPQTPDTSAMDEALQQALKDGKGLGGGMKPAGLGGGVGGVGVPSVPLAPASDAAAAPASATPGGAGAPGPGRGMPGVGGMGGGMGGGMPMAPGAGQQQNQSKSKRPDTDEDALYTEERAWTEGVIGNRPRKPGPPGPIPGPDRRGDST